MRPYDGLRDGVAYWWEATVEDDTDGAWIEMDGTTTGVAGTTVEDVRTGLVTDLWRRGMRGARVTRFDMGEKR